MITRICLITFSTLALLFCSFSANAQFGSSIEGFIRDESHAPVYNAYVELYNSTGSQVDRQRSSSSGRFTFRGMPEGRYVISVKPFGTKLLEESQEVELIRLFGRATPIHIDFRLKVDKRFVSQRPTITGTVFVQEVPESAKQLYKSAMYAIESDKGERGLSELGKAIEIFPEYFDALTVLGKKYILIGNYEKGYPYLLRAVDVNRRCTDCYYSLSLAFYRLNELAAATKAIDAAAILQPKNSAVSLLQGMIYRANNDLTGAEKFLLLAKSLFDEPNSEVHWQLSLVYNRLKRNKEAADELEQYLKTKSGLNAAEKESVRNLISKLRKST